MTSNPTQIRKRKWRRRLGFALAGLLVLAILARLLLVILLPPVMRMVVGRFGLISSYDRMELHLLSGDVGFWNFALDPKDGGARVVECRYLRCHVSTLDLLSGDLHVYRIEAEGVDLPIERTANGEIPLLTRFASSSSASTSSSSNGGSFQIPQLRVDAFRLTDIHAHITDDAANPSVHSDVSLNVLVTNLNSPTLPTSFQVSVLAPPICNFLLVEGKGDLKGHMLDTSLRVQAQGLRPKHLEGYLRPLGIRPVADTIDLSTNVRLQTWAAQSSQALPGDLGAALTLDGIQANVDDQPAASLQKLEISLEYANFHSAKISRLLAQGGWIKTSRDLGGEVGAIGLQWVGQPQAPGQITINPSAKPLNYRLAVGRIDLRDLQASFHDEAVWPHADLLGRLDMTAEDFDPFFSTQPSKINLNIAAPGIFDSLNVNAQAYPFTATKSLDAKVAGKQIQLAALQPYLNAVGLESDYRSGDLTATIHAQAKPAENGYAADARISDVHLSDGAELISLDNLDIRGARYQLNPAWFHVDSVDISGPSAGITHEPSGAFAFLGLHTRPAVGQIAAATATPSLAITLPRFSIDHFRWKNLHLQFDDLAEPKTSFATSDFGVQLTNLKLDEAGSTWAEGKGKLHAWLSVPNLIGNLSADGDLGNSKDGWAADVDVSGSRLTLMPLAKYFPSSRVQPDLKDGALHLSAHVGVAPTNNGWSLTAGAKDCAGKDGSDFLFALKSGEISAELVNGNFIQVKTAKVDSGQLWASRQSDGSLHVAGIAILPQVSTIAPPPIPVATTTAPAVVSATQPSITARIDKFIADNAALHWTDAAVDPPISANFSASAVIDGLAPGQATPAKITAHLHEDRSLDDLTAVGTFGIGPDFLSANLQCDATGIQGGDLGRYLPPPAQVNLVDGHFHAVIDALAHQRQSDGYDGHVYVHDLDYRDAASPDDLCRFDSFQIDAARIDPLAGVYDVDSIALKGLQSSARITGDGTLNALGLTLGTPAAGGQSTPPTAAEQPSVANAAAAEIKAVTASDLAAAQSRYPFFSLGKLSLNLRQFTFTDDSRPQVAPLVLRDFYLWNNNPWEALGRSPQDRKPLQIRIDGEIDPLAQNVDVTIATAPLVQQPRVDVTLNVAGIHGKSVNALVPQLNSYVDGKSLTDGQFRARLSAQLMRNRPDALDFNFARGVTLNGSVHDVEFRAKPNGSILAGVKAVRLDSISIRPSEKIASIKSIDVTDLSGHFWRDSQGINVLGLTFKLPVTEVSSPSKKATVLVVKLPPTVANSSEAKPTSPWSVGVDKITASGLDFSFEDRTCNPTLVVPLNSLDLEAHDLSNGLSPKVRPMRFDVLVNSGRGPGQSQDFFSQAEAAGAITPGSQIQGWIKSSVSAVNLSALSSSASQYGVNLGGGTFDGAADLRFNGDGSIGVQSNLVLTDLKVTEPDNGPIQRLLMIQVPLGVAIAAVQGPDGSISIPANATVRAGQISQVELAEAIAAAVSSVVASAVASAPLRAADLGLSILGANNKNQGGDQPVTIPFSAGQSMPSNSDSIDLRQLLNHMRDDSTTTLTLRAQLGGGDVARCAILANPSPSECRSLAYALRQKKLRLLAERDEAADRVRAQLASGFGSESDAEVQHLRALEVSIANTEDALDTLYDILRPGAEHQADRRTRAACLQIAQMRLESIRDALLSSGIPNIDKRMRLLHPAFNPTADTDGSVVLIPGHKKAG